MASILAAAVLACSPSLAPALAALWIVAIVLTAVTRRGVGLSRVLWLAIPSAVVFAPLVWHRVRTGAPWALLADPGVPLVDPGVAGAGRRLLLALGFPTGDGWDAFVGSAIAAWTPLLVVPLLALAVAAPVIGRSLPASVLVIAALFGLTTAVVAIGFSVASDASNPVTIWPGAALSMYWLGALCAAALALDAVPSRVRLRTPLAALVMVTIAVSAAPALTASLRGTAAITESRTSTLPAYVEAQADGGPATATFVLTPTDDGAVITDIVWGGTASLGGQSTLRSARTTADAGDRTTAEYAAQLIADPEGPVVSELAAHGVAFVLLAGDADDPASAASGIRIEAENALNQREDLEIVGDTARGRLWVVATDVTGRASVDTGTAWRDGALQGGAILAALLLAIPTRRSLEIARRSPRVVGLPRPVRTRERDS